MPLQHGRVVGKIVTATADGPDDDNLPDIIGATKRKPKFTPIVASFVASELEALVTADPITCQVGPDGTLLDGQGNPGVTLVVGEYVVDDVPLVKKVVVRPEHMQTPLELWQAVSYEPPPATTVQTVVVPAGATEGEVLAWVDGKLGWTAGGGGGEVDLSTVARVEGGPLTIHMDQVYTSIEQIPNEGDGHAYWLAEAP